MPVVAILLVLVGGWVVLWIVWNNSAERRACEEAVAAANRFRAEVESCVAFASSAVQDRATAARNFVEAQRTMARQAVSIEDLREVGVKNVRWSSLAEAGITTLDDLHRKSAVDLMALPGIGDASAQRLAAGARIAAQRIEEQPVPMPSSNLRHPASLALVAAVVRAREAEALHAELATALEEQAHDLQAKVSFLGARATMLRWAFAGQGRGENGSISREAKLLHDAVQGWEASGELSTARRRRAAAESRWPKSPDGQGRLEASIREIYPRLQDAITATLRSAAPRVVDWRTDLST